MTPTPSPASITRPRWRAVFATFALVGALVASAVPLSATAADVGTGPGVISGVVTNADGQPLEGAFVGAAISDGEGTAFWAYGNTDSAGHYEFADLALGYTYGISASLPGHQTVPWKDVTLTETSTTGTADFVLAPFASGLGTISGHITGDGSPLANQYVSAYEYSTGQNINGSSDENGYYEFTGLANGEWSIFASAGPQYQSLNPPPVQLTDGATNATVDLPFVSWPVGTASISGVVTDSATGEPLAGVSVSAYSEDAPHNSNQSTDETGAFRFDLLPAGTYYLGFSTFGYLHSDQEIHVVDDQSATTNQALVATNASISGHVKTQNGAPAAGIYVDAHSSGGNIGGAVTDDNGDYVISDIGAVAYTLTVGGPGTPFNQKERVVTPPANGNVVANFTLTLRTTGSLGGIVYGPGGTNYTEPVCVTLYSSKSKKPVAEVVTYGPEYGDGTYAFADLKPGRYTVEFEDCDDDPATKFDNVYLGGAKTYKDATFVTVVAGEDSWGNDHTLTYKAANSTISGRIVKSNGAPIVGLAVHANGGTLGSGQAVTDANGNYTISSLFSGRYTVSAGGTGTAYVLKEKSVTVIENGGATANLSLVKRTTGSISGVITAATTGSPVKGTCVIAYKASREEAVAIRFTRTDGSYTLDGLAPGKYKIKVVDCDHSAPRYATEFYGGVSKWKNATQITVVAGGDFVGGNVSLDRKH